MTPAPIQSIGLTHTGTVRKINEDAFVSMPEIGLFGVADGMGGVAGGAFASSNAINAVTQSAKMFEESSPLDVRISRLRGVIDQSNREIRAWAEHQGVTGTGTTVILLTFDPSRPEFAALLHAGDSRAYLVRGGKLKQLTRDHSVAESFGNGSEDSVPAAFRNVITNAIGMNSEVKLDETLVSLHNGDTVLLCSDGLYRMVKDEEIRSILEAPLTLEDRAAALINCANENGGKDNATVVLIHLPRSASDTTDGLQEQETHDTDMKSALDASREAKHINPTDTDDSVISGRPFAAEDISIRAEKLIANESSSPPVRGGKNSVKITLCFFIVLLLSGFFIRHYAARDRSTISAPPEPANANDIQTPPVASVAVPAETVEVIIQRARETGDWGFPVERLAEIEQDESGAKTVESARAWIAEWNKALNDTTNAWAEINEFRTVCEKIITIWSAGYSLPAIELWPGEKNEAARLYCYDRLRIQEHLFSEMDSYVSGVAQVISAFGKKPTDVETRLRSASGTRETEAPQLEIRLKKMRSMLRSLNRWNGRSRDLPLGIVETKSIASTFIEPLEADVRELFSEVAVYLASIAPAKDSIDETRQELRAFYEQKNEYLKAFSNNTLLVNADREMLAQHMSAMFNSPGLQDLAAGKESKGSPSP